MRHSPVAVVLAFALPCIVLAHAACGSDPIPTCLDSNNCSAFNDGGASDAFADVIVPAGCDLTKAPKDSLPCVDDAVGVFVSPTGDDGSVGGKGAPVKSIAKGVELAASRGRPRVYVCEGSYDVAVEIKSAVAVFGGLSCAWAPNGTKPKLAPPKGVALKITGVAGAVRVEDLEIVGTADSAPGSSAIGVFVANSTAVTFERLSIAAGAGVAGETKLQKTQAANATQGITPTTTTGGASVKNTCSDGDSIGGAGGTAGANDAMPGLPALAGGKAGAVATDCTMGGAGTTGTSGETGASAVAITTLGDLTQSGWVPLSGPAGKTGTRAQGGGGGGSRTGAGGSGGAGGCGGGGGDGGGGGGASVAIAVLSSTLTVRGSQLTASAAGDGGGGANGQLGQPPGGGGNGGTAAPFNGCAGGQGGTGGNGGGGGGGAGGVSAGIIYKGTSPTTDPATTITPGTLGAAGKGAATNDGPPGVSIATLKID